MRFGLCLTVIGLAMAWPAAVRARAEPVAHGGMCDASAGVPVGPALFVAANDEDNVLRVYRRDAAGNAVAQFDLNSSLALEPKHPECDIEGATRLGDRVWWIASHGRNKEGKKRPNRHRLFATEIGLSGDEVTLKRVGTPCARLADVLADDPRLAAYDFRKAAKRRPEEAGALNIEGLAASPEGALLIGFRNPIVAGRALIVPLMNPDAVLAGQEPRLGDPIALDLAGLGVRSIEYFAAGKHYLILAGPHDGEGAFRLYRWAGPGSAPEQVTGVDLSGFRPEAIVVYRDQAAAVQLLSDDGTMPVDGSPCKKAAPEKRSFRSLWVRF